MVFTVYFFQVSAFKAGTQQSNCEWTGLLWKQVQKTLSEKNSILKLIQYHQWVFKHRKCYNTLYLGANRC